MSNLLTAAFGAGCFWGVENKFMNFQGVLETSVGYMGSEFKNPTYFDVCSGLTGHAEVVMVQYDSNIVDYKELCNFFFQSHDATTVNRQGPDVGTQYRSIIFYYDTDQRDIASEIIFALNEQKTSIPVVTEVAKAMQYYLAEEYHQKYISKNNFESCGV
jgi:peptide-methionine (S)-S-oxide reductase